MPRWDPRDYAQNARAQAIWADELAKHCGTIPYEILTGISRQIERRYFGA